MTKYNCDDGNCEVEIEADSAREAAQEYVDGGDWGEIESTLWITVYTWVGDDRDDRETYTVAVDPDEPTCDDGDHDWQAPHDRVGGLTDNPGVWGHGGGVKIHEVCVICGTRRHTDTWAQNPATGEQGLTSLSYEGAEEPVK